MFYIHINYSINVNAKCSVSNKDDTQNESSAHKNIDLNVLTLPH